MGIQRAQKFCAVCYYFRKFGDSPNRRTAEIFKIRYVLPNLTFFYIISLLSDKQSSAKGPPMYHYADPKSKLMYYVRTRD